MSNWKENKQQTMLKLGKIITLQNKLFEYLIAPCLEISKWRKDVTENWKRMISEIVYVWFWNLIRFNKLSYTVDYSKLHEIHINIIFENLNILYVKYMFQIYYICYTLLYLLYLFVHEFKINIYSKIYSKFPLLHKILVSFMLLFTIFGKFRGNAI